VSLQHLTSLLLAFCYDADAPVLAQMTQLISLTLRRPRDVTHTGLLHLTALTRLTRLKAWLSSPGAALVQPDGAPMDAITNKVSLVAQGAAASQGLCVLIDYIEAEHGSTDGLKLRMSSLMAHAVCQEHLLMQLQSPTCA
jgi:hypothetical protein